MEPVRSETFARFEEYLRALQGRIVSALGEIEPTPFERKDWTRADHLRTPTGSSPPSALGGGGHMATVRGDVIEKGAVLTSSVHGRSNPLTQRPFRAAGLSLILHPANPHAPTVHMNVRRFEETEDAWWGGGMDLTPMGVWHAEDVERFHATLRTKLGERYEAGRKGADEYFFVPHRQRARGAGGVFYDHVREPGDELVRAIGDAFLDAYLPILEARARLPATVDEREKQLKDRGVYVEFNLLYDRGTRFGFQSGGDPEAILASLPPLVRW